MANKNKKKRPVRDLEDEYYDSSATKNIQRDEERPERSPDDEE